MFFFLLLFWGACRIGNGNFNFNGGGFNHLCLPWNAEFNGYNTSSNENSLLYFTEYRGTNVVLDRTLVNRDAACALCRTPASSVLMIPGAVTSCPSGFHVEYAGWLMSSHNTYAHPTDFICVDLFQDSFNTSSTTAAATLNILWFTEAQLVMGNANAEGCVLFLKLNKLSLCTCTL